MLSIFNILDVNAGINWLNDIKWLSETSIKTSWSSSSVSGNIQTIWLSLLEKVKYVLSWVMLIFIVYAWAQMILSMWTDEDNLSNSKRTIWYSLIWLVFINIPWTLYEAFVGTNKSVAWGIWNTWSSNIKDSIFINTDVFTATLNDSIIWFIEIMIASIAVLVIILAAFKVLSGNEENVKEGKTKIIWSLAWLIFIWFIESWQTFAFNGKVSDWVTIFDTLANLMLFLAWPIAIMFLTMAWYYLVTSNWDEEKLTKAKSIIVNVVIGTIIILCSYIFLNDIASLLK